MRSHPFFRRGLTIAALALAAPLAAGLTIAPFAPQDTAEAQEDLPTIEDGQALLGSDPAAAAKVFEKIAAAQPDNGQAVFFHAFALHMAGDLDAAHDRHLDAAAFPQFAPVALYNHACVHALRNEKDLTIRSLREAMAAGFDNLQQLLDDSDMDNVRSDGRFQEILLELQPAGTYRGTPLTDLASLPPERRYDFYIGEWDMLNGETVERRITVERGYGGKGLTTTALDVPSGVTSAHSMYVYDEANGVWRQTWMQNDGLVVVMEGKLDGGALVLRTTMMGGELDSSGRSVFKDVTADSFTYEWQTTADDGATWTTVATRSFRRR